MAGLFRQLKSNGALGLSLAYASPVGAITVRGDVLDLEGNDIAASQFAVDGQIEQRQIADSLLDLELGPDPPNMLLQ